jgi:hypothetical protein
VLALKELLLEVSAGHVLINILLSGLFLALFLLFDHFRRDIEVLPLLLRDDTLQVFSDPLHQSLTRPLY